jgi:glycosyltransferase involved in cell wall biosynthesis
MVKDKRILIIHSAIQHNTKLYQSLKQNGNDVKMIVPFIVKNNNFFKLLKKIGGRRISKYSSKREIHGIDTSDIINVYWLQVVKSFIAIICSDRNKEKFYRKLDHLFDYYIALLIRFKYKNINIVVSYPNVCLKTFGLCKDRKICTIIDLPTFHHNEIDAILNDEKVRYPNFADQLMNPISSYRDRLTQELNLSDKIVVPSKKVYETCIINNVPKDKLIIIPYGANFEAINCKKVKSEEDILKIIIIGQIQQRKGISYVLDLSKRLQQNNYKFQITFCGQNLMGEFFTKSLNSSLKYNGFLNRKALQDEINKNDIILSFSLIEGFSLAILECMSQGVVPIVTENSGADFIVNNETGFINEIRNVDEVYNQIDYLYHNRKELRRIKINALKISANYTWEIYGNKWNKLIHNL